MLVQLEPKLALMDVDAERSGAYDGQRQPGRTTLF